ncbi:MULTISPECIES: hypothetical protein [Comamonas]|uniref:Ceramidase n=1 Tax=Comamonas squillarum TaxID=2977320 RepID=A0ABY5ZRW9_9BURK|nr:MULTISPECIES: hypothetical protein [Comamonas]UXC16717.1 hypothetical protein N4T19_13310 [Comamonas sp. PR12]
MTDTSQPPSPRSLAAECVLYAFYAAMLALACLGPYVPQAAHYHDFADQRPLLGLANAADVLSNLPFLLVGIWGLLASVKTPADTLRSQGAQPWLLLVFGGLVLTAVGSSYYHLLPGDVRVFWDRMGMVPVFAGVLGLALQSQLNARAAWLTALAVLLGGPLALWIWLQTGQLLPWAVLQGAGMVLLVVVALWQQRSPPAAPLIRWPLAAVVAWYALAKLFELGDAAVWAGSGHLVAGHALKHLAAALALVPLLRTALQARQLACPNRASAGTIGDGALGAVRLR